MPKRLSDRYPDFQKEPTPVVPKWDPLRYDLLPKGDQLLEHVAPWTEPTFQHWLQPGTIYHLFDYCLFGFLFVHIGLLVGPLALADHLIPWWALLTLFYVAQRFLQTYDTGAALRQLLGAPTVYAGLLLLYCAQRYPLAHVALLAFALIFAAHLVDSIFEHNVRALLADTTDPLPLRERWKALLSKRWAPLVLKTPNQEFSEADRERDRLFRRGVRRHRRGFLVLLVPVVARVLWPDDAWQVTLIASPLIAVLLSLDALPGSLPSLAGAVEHFIHYGAGGESAPGVFRSPAGLRNPRLMLACGTFALITAALAPGAQYFRLLLASGSFPVFIETLWSISLQLLGIFVLPLVLIGSVLFAVAARALTPIRQALEPDDPAAHEVARWHTAVSDLQQSENPLHRRQLLVGYHATVGYPVFLPVPSLHEHAHILGATGSGKTSRAILPLATQLMRLRDESNAGAVVVIDLKGEPYLFHAVRREAERAGRPFAFFSNTRRQSTHAFNPLLDLAELGLTPLQIGETIRAALNLEHGAGYGMGYFSAVTRGYLSDLLEANPGVRSFYELYAYSQRPRPRRPEERDREEKAYEFTSTLRLLAMRPELNVLPEHGEVFAHRIRMAEVVRNRGVVYFSLNAHAEEALVRFIASLAMECLYTACLATKGRAYAFLDEFQIVAGRNFALFLQQARSAGLSLIMTNQAREDLPPELLTAVDQNTAYRQFFTARTPESLGFLESISGFTLEELSGEDYPNAFSVGSLTSRLGINDLQAISSNEELSVIVQANNRDYSQFESRPLIIRSPRTLLPSEKTAFEAAPWPAPSPRTTLVGTSLDLSRATLASTYRRPSNQEPPREVSPAPATVPTPPTDSVTPLLARIRVTPDGYVPADQPAPRPAPARPEEPSPALLPASAAAMLDRIAVTADGYVEAG